MVHLLYDGSQFAVGAPDTDAEETIIGGGGGFSDSLISGMPPNRLYPGGLRFYRVDFMRVRQREGSR